MQTLWILEYNHEVRATSLCILNVERLYTQRQLQQLTPGVCIESLCSVYVMQYRYKYLRRAFHVCVLFAEAFSVCVMQYCVKYCVERYLSVCLLQ